MDNLIDLLKRFVDEILDIRILISIFVAIVIFIIEIKLTTNIDFKNKRIEKTKKLSHVIKAKKIKMYDEDTSGHDIHSYFHATYTYEVNNKTYEYRFMDKVVPPYELTLYYLNNLARAFRQDDTSKRHALGFIALIIPILAGIICALLLGVF